MTWAVPHTWVTGEMEDAARFNQDVRDNLNALVPQYATVATTETTTSLAYTDLATAGPSVTANTLTQAIVILSSRIQNGTAGSFAFASYEVSSATTIAASDNWAYDMRTSDVSNPFNRGTKVHQRTDLTAGSNVFTMKFRAFPSGTATFSDRELFVIPVGPAR